MSLYIPWKLKCFFYLYVSDSFEQEKCLGYSFCVIICKYMRRQITRGLIWERRLADVRQSFGSPEYNMTHIETHLLQIREPCVSISFDKKFVPQREGNVDILNYVIDVSPKNCKSIFQANYCRNGSYAHRKSGEKTIYLLEMRKEASFNNNSDSMWHYW